MSKKALKKWALLLILFIAMEASRLNAQSLTGNSLTVNGNSSLNGNVAIQDDLFVSGSFTLGEITSTSYPGLVMSYTNPAGSNPAVITFQADEASNDWLWEAMNYSNGLTYKQMLLDSNNGLSLYPYSSSATQSGVYLTPNSGGVSTFASSVTISGADNEMPNQGIVNNNSVLTLGLASTRFVSSTSLGTATISGSFAIGSGNSAFHSSLDVGNQNFAFAGSLSVGTGNSAQDSSAAFGGDTTASGAYSFASGHHSQATAINAFAAGNYNQATGGESTVFGGYNTASGSYSTALGSYTSASGYYSTAAGLHTTAASFEDFVVGQYNAYNNPSNVTNNSWVGTDPVFEVGNGNLSQQSSTPITNTLSSYYVSGSAYNNGNINGSQSGYYPGYYEAPAANQDAFVVYKNGNAAVQGTLTTGSCLYANGGINTGSVYSGWITTNGISDNGTVSANSVTTGTITASGIITAHAGGDIPMYSGE